MTAESAKIVHFSSELWQAEFANLAAQARDCRRRQTKVLVGERREMLRYDALSEQLETLVRRHLAAGSPAITIPPEDVTQIDEDGNRNRDPWFATLEAPPVVQLFISRKAPEWGSDGWLFELREPLTPGERPDRKASIPAPTAPAAVWRPPSNERGLQAVAARWRQQLQSSVDAHDEPIVPSGVSNRVLTEELRRFADQGSRTKPAHVRVVYRDGSEASRFPLASLALASRPPFDWPVVRVALLSMRHSEMDADVDAAWLRNRDISQIRPAAETDRLVDAITREQLRDLTRYGRRIVRLYQTGLEPAIIGFYRALIAHLLDQPGSIAVVPNYYRRDGSDAEGTVWTSPA